jgi:hypothetical protein
MSTWGSTIQELQDATEEAADAMAAQADAEGIAAQLSSQLQGHQHAAAQGLVRRLTSRINLESPPPHGTLPLGKRSDVRLRTASECSPTQPSRSRQLSYGQGGGRARPARRLDTRMKALIHCVIRWIRPLKCNTQYFNPRQTRNTRDDMNHYE